MHFYTPEHLVFPKIARIILSTSPSEFNPNDSSGRKTTQVVIFILFFIFISSLWRLYILITALSQFSHFIIGKDSDKLFKRKNALKLIYSKKNVTEHKYNILFLSIQKNRTQIILNPLFVEFFLIWSYFFNFKCLSRHEDLRYHNLSLLHFYDIFCGNH